MNKSNMNSTSGNDQAGQAGQGGKEAIVDQAKQAVSNVAGQAKEQVSNQLDTRKEKAVETIGNVASAIRDTSEKLKGVGPLGDVAERAADGLERAAAFFEGKRVGDIVRDVERFARREPALFLGAAFAIGLIGGRFLKSSPPQRDSATQGGFARQGWVESDRDDLVYGSSYGEGGVEDSFISEDDLHEEEEEDTPRTGAQGEGGKGKKEGSG